MKRGCQVRDHGEQVGSDASGESFYWLLDEIMRSWVLILILTHELGAPAALGAARRPAIDRGPAFRHIAPRDLIHWLTT